MPEEVIAAVLAHHARRAADPGRPAADGEGLGYRAESLNILFGEGTA